MRNLYIFLLLLVGIGVFGQISPVVETKYSPNGYFEKVFDHYGNSYQLKDLRVGAAIKVGSTTSKTTLNVCNSGIFELYFEDNWYGNSATTDVQDARKAVICRVFKDLSDFIVTPLKDVGNTTKVKIWVRNIANLPNVPSNALGLATSFYTMPYNANTNFGGIIDNEVWKTITLGSDSFVNVTSPLTNTNGSQTSSGNFYHGMMAFNFNSVNWNTNLATNAPTSQYDLYTVVLHEVTHALGFASLMDANGQSVFGTGYNYFSRYDALLKNNSGSQQLITNTGACSTMYNYSFNSALNTSILHPNTNSCITDQTTCITAIKFFGPTNTSSVYNPNCFEQGSSLSHFEDQCIAPPNQGNNTYFAMTNAVGTAVTKRFLKPEERNALSDIGYRLNTAYGSTSVLNSSINYGGSTPTTGINVAGSNDGLDPISDFYTFIGNVGTPINLTNLLGNDKNAVSFECLQDVFDGTATISTTSGTDTSSITFSSIVDGLHLLRYVPISSSGERGNITYIYVYLNLLDNCNDVIANPCDLVLNGDFEINTGIPTNTGQFNRICKWQSVSINNQASNEYFHINSPPRANVPCNFVGFENVKNNSGSGYGGMVIIRDNQFPNDNYTEIIKTRLTTPLQPNSTYRLKLDVSLAEGVSSNAIRFQAYFSNTEISTTNNVPFITSQINTQMLFTNSNFSQTTGGWEEIQLIITTGNVSGEQFMYLGAINNIEFMSRTSAAQVSGCNYTNLNQSSFSQKGYCYYYLDNVSLVPIYGTFDLPNQICNNVVLANLTHFLEAIPTNGVFSGNGVSFDNGIYSFNAGVGFHTITYTFTNTNGCEVSISDTIEVVSDSIVPEFDPIAPICSGGSIALPTTSVNFINGTWSPAINNTATTTYTFTPNANQCGAVTTSLTVTVLPTNDPSCNSNPCLPNLTLSTTENNSTIIYKRANWIEANASYVVDVNKNVTMKAGDYIVFNTDSHLKSGSEVTALIEVCTPTSKSSNVKTIEKTILEEAILNESIVLFPNPTTDRLTIASDSAAMNSVVITAMDGKIIYSNQTVNASKLELDTSSYQGGIYMVAITTTNGTSFIRKLVKN